MSAAPAVAISLCSADYHNVSAGASWKVRLRGVMAAKASVMLSTEEQSAV